MSVTMLSFQNVAQLLLDNVCLVAHHSSKVSQGLEESLPMFIGQAQCLDDLLILPLNGDQSILLGVIGLAFNHLRPALRKPRNIIVVYASTNLLLRPRVVLRILLIQLEEERHVVPLVLLVGLVVVEAVSNSSLLRYCLNGFSIDARDKRLRLQNSLTRTGFTPLCLERIHDKRNDGIQKHDSENHKVAYVVCHSAIPGVILWHHVLHHAAKPNDSGTGAHVQDTLRADEDILIAVVIKIAPEVVRSNGSINKGDNPSP
mmetsp:Transcript_106454/g.189255  ORF Transcript_106454/g.189255 Transcript_106454/m.189255 type:complete len:259 (+) Transcript_106454:191-967(+)